MIWRIAKDGFTETHSGPTIDVLDPAARYVFSASPQEDRAGPAIWTQALVKRARNCVEVVAQCPRHIETRSAGVPGSAVLTSSEGLTALVGTGPIYIDISGLAHHVWAPLLRAALRSCVSVKVVYFEPDTYRAHSSPSSTSQFALSEGSRGVEPIPGFANLVGPPGDGEALFVPFLGFEGPRARQVAMTLDPIPKTIPIVGLPGFRVDYPQTTLSSNLDFLVENDANRHVRYARASCPFEAYSALVEIRRDNPGCYLYVAPLGTKPHALGAIWFALDNPSDSEIMYDHPIRTPGRTRGVGPAHVYHLKA